MIWGAGAKVRPATAAPDGTRKTVLGQPPWLYLRLTSGRLSLSTLIAMKSSLIFAITSGSE